MTGSRERRSSDRRRQPPPAPGRGPRRTARWKAPTSPLATTAGLPSRETAFHPTPPTPRKPEIVALRQSGGPAAPTTVTRRFS